MPVKAALRHELVDDEEPFAAVTPTDQLHEIAVPEPADDLHLGLELLPPLHRRLRELLYGHTAVLAVDLEAALVDVAEAASPQLHLLREIARRRREFAVTIPLWADAFLKLSLAAAVVFIVELAAAAGGCFLGFLPHPQFPPKNKPS